jgi:hypothetical protein
MNDVNEKAHEEALVRQLLQSALPPVRSLTPTRDLWPDVVRRSQRPPRWTSVDSSIAAIVVLALLLFPKWFWFLAYHL